MRPRLPLLLVLLLPLWAYGQSVEEEARTAYEELVAATRRLRADAADADARALCERACARYVLRVWAHTLWAVSEGTVGLRRVTLRDQAEQVGELHTPRGVVGAGMLSDETYAMVNLGVLLIPGRCGAFTFVHEVGHLLFWLPEEYDTPGGCPCAQAGERGRLTWCDDDSHSEEQRALGKASCWTQILRRFPQLRHPGPKGEPPALEITIDDRPGVR